MGDAKKTPLYDMHRLLGGKMVDFAGFLMPVAYGSIIDEHRAVRERVGMFDVSHMGEFLVAGPRARSFVNQIITNDCSRLSPGALQYTVMCGEDGTVVDDLLVYAVDEERLLLVVNAANIDKDLDHVSSFDMAGVDFRNVSDHYALIAVQGPKTREVLATCPLFEGVSNRLDDTAYYYGFTFDTHGAEVLVSRTGYTGELGFEIFVPADLAETTWTQIQAAGEPHGVAAVGLGARDTLRFEASYCLYGHELDEKTTPLEAGLGWVVRLGKEGFRGQEALQREKQRGSKRMLVGLELDGRSIARHGYAVMKEGHEVGRVTSGTFAPTLEKSLCMALVEVGAVGNDKGLSVRIRDREVAATRTPLPFYKSRAK